MSNSRAHALVGIIVGAIGVFFGAAAYTFHYAKGTSYMSSDPRACINCHIMQDQFDSWQKSSHHAVAGCVECHLPHSFAPKWLAKMENGYHHSKAFTLQNFVEPIRIGRKNAKILKDNCLACHGEIAANAGGHGGARGSLSCVACHARVGLAEHAD